jgi:hypothetical protein
VQRVFSSPGSRAVQALGLAFVATALSTGNFLFDVSIEITRMKLISITRRCDVL